MTTDKEEKIKTELKKEIKDLMFATCPIEEKEPFFWRWTEHGLDRLSTYIQAKLHSLQQEIVEEVKNKIQDYKIGGKDLPKEEQRIDDLLDEIIADVLKIISSNKE